MEWLSLYLSFTVKFHDKSTWHFVCFELVLSFSNNVGVQRCYGVKHNDVSSHGLDVQPLHYWFVPMQIAFLSVLTIGRMK